MSANPGFAGVVVQKRLEALDVAAGHEVIAGALDDDDANRIVVSDLGGDLFQGAGHVRVDGVQ